MTHTACPVLSTPSLADLPWICMALKKTAVVFQHDERAAAWLLSNAKKVNYERCRFSGA